MLLEGCVVDQDIEPAEFLHRAADGLLAEFRIGDIARDHDAAAALLLDRAFGFLGVLMLVEIGDRDIGAFARIEHRYRTADA